MKKNYIIPAIEVTELETMAIIAASKVVSYDADDVIVDDEAVGSKVRTDNWGDIW